MLYGIPRSTLRNKVYKLAMERERNASLSAANSASTHEATAAATGVLGAHLTGLKEAARMFPKIKAKRREIQRGRKLSNGEVLRLVRGAALDSTASVARSCVSRCRVSLYRQRNNMLRGTTVTCRSV